MGSPTRGSRRCSPRPSATPPPGTCPSLHAIGDVVGTEARAKFNAKGVEGDHGWFNGLTVWSPNINIFRDPRWGRGQETYGEDPFLTARMGVAFIQGMQGDDPLYMQAVACAKHFAVHSGPEPLRHRFDVHPPGAGPVRDLPAPVRGRRARGPRRAGDERL